MAETIGELLVRLKADASSLEKALNESVGNTEKAGSKMASSLNKISSAGKTLAYVLATIISVKTLKEVTDVTIRWEGLKNAFTAVTGSADTAAETLDFVRRTSNELGIDVTTAASAFRSMTAAAKGTSLEGKPIEDAFYKISAASRTMGLTTDETRAAFLAITQMISKTTVQSEELRGQLAERLPGSVEAMARAVGVGTKELNKMLEQGQVLTKDVLPKFADEIYKSIEAGVGAATSSAGAAFARLGNAITEFMRTVGETGLVKLFAGLANEASYALTQISKKFEEPKKAAELFNKAIKPSEELINRFGLSIDYVDPSNLEDVNRVVVAMEKNGVDLLATAPYLPLAHQIEVLQKNIEDITKLQQKAKPDSDAYKAFNEILAKRNQQLTAAQKAFLDLFDSQNQSIQQDQESSKQAENLITKLQQKIAQLGRTEEEYLKYQLIMADANDNQLKFGSGLVDTYVALKQTSTGQDEFNKYLEQFNKITGQAAVEEQTKQLAALEKALELNKISLADYFEVLASISGVPATPATYNPFPSEEELQAGLDSVDKYLEDYKASTQTSAEDQLALLQQQHDDRLFNIEDAFQGELIIAEEAATRRTQLEKATAAQEDKIQRASMRSKLNIAQQGFSALMSLGQGRSRLLFEIGKAGAIGTAIVDAYLAYNEAMSNPPGPPYTIPIAAAAIAGGLASVAAIASTSYGSGATGGGAPTVAAGTAPTPVATTPQPPQVQAPAQAPARTRIAINLGDEEGLISKNSVRKLIERINQEIEDGVILGGVSVA